MSENTTLNQLTLLPEESLASLTVWPGSEQAQRMTETSGRNIAALLENSSPLGLLLKMFLVSKQPYSTRLFLTWKVWSTKQGRLLFRLAPSMPRTFENEYLLLPTPRASDGDHGGPNQRDSNGKPGLSSIAHTWPTPRANDSEKRGNIANDRRNGLPAAVRLWPTPKSRDWRSGGTDPTKIQARIDKRRNRGVIDLPDAVTLQANRDLPTGQLNPEWVEWLMGFPIGWTDLEDSETPLYLR